MDSPSFSSFEALVDSMSREVWENMRRAVELGKWPDGRVLSAEQRALSLQAVLAWEARNQVPERERTGHVPRPDCESDHIHSLEQILTLRPAKGDDDHA